MELSFTELDTLDKTQNKESNYKHNTYYDDLLSKSNVQHKQKSLNTKENSNAPVFLNTKTL